MVKKKNQELPPAPDMVFCNQCEKWKTLQEVYFNRPRNAYYGPCKECQKKRLHQYRLNNKEMVRDKYNLWKLNNRGLLCVRCNVGIGCAKDSVSTILSAIKYVESFRVVENA